MAATSKKGKRQKGKTIQLTDFLSEGVSTPADGKAVVTVSSWADEVEENEDSYPPQTEQVALPRAPRAARQEIDISLLPDRPPYTLYVGNLSYDVDEESLTQFFDNMKVNVRNARLVRENDRLKGYGYVEFADKQSLVDALKADGELFLNRKLKVDLATQSGNRDEDGRGGERSQITGEGDADDDWRTSAGSGSSSYESSSYGRNRDSGFGRNRDDRDSGFGRRDDKDGYGPPRDRFGGPSEADSADSWSRGPPRDDRDGGYGTPRDRYGGPSEADTADSWSRGPPRRSGNEDRSFGSSSSSRRGYDERDSGYGSRRGYDDRDSGSRSGYNDRDSGYNRRGYDDKEYGGGRRGNDDRDRRYNSYGSRGRDYSPPRSSYRNDGYGSSRSAPRYDGYNRNGRNDDRGSGYDRPSSSEAPKERPKLNLAPRTKPAESSKDSGSASSSTSVFGNAKPVDTAAKEREIEERLRRGQESRTAPRDGRESRDSGSSFGSRDIRTNVERRVFNEHPSSDEKGGSQPNGCVEEKPERVKKPSSASIFGDAKPIDTAKREREIEERLQREREAESGHNDSAPSERRHDRHDRGYDNRDRHQDSRNERRDAPRPNAWNKGPPPTSSEHPPRKDRHERALPQSIDEMPQYKETEGHDFSDSNKYAGLLGSDGDDDGKD